MLNSNDNFIPSFLTLCFLLFLNLNLVFAHIPSEGVLNNVKNIDVWEQSQASLQKRYQNKNKSKLEMNRGVRMELPLNFPCCIFMATVCMIISFGF